MTTSKREERRWPSIKIGSSTRRFISRLHLLRRVLSSIVHDPNRSVSQFVNVLCSGPKLRWSLNDRCATGVIPYRRRLTHRAPPSSRAQEIRYFLHRVVRASIYHDTYARLSSPLSPFEHRQKNHEPPSCCCVYTNFQRTTKASLAGVLTVSSRHVPSSQISFDVLVFRSLLAADWNRRVHQTLHAISCPECNLSHEIFANIGVNPTNEFPK